MEYNLSSLRYDHNGIALTFHPERDSWTVAQEERKDENVFIWAAVNIKGKKPPALEKDLTSSRECSASSSCFRATVCYVGSSAV